MENTVAYCETATITVVFDSALDTTAMLIMTLLIVTFLIITKIIMPNIGGLVLLNFL